MLDSIYQMAVKVLKFPFCVKTFKILQSSMQHYTEHYYVALLCYDTKICIHFIAWHYFTPRGDVM